MSLSRPLLDRDSYFDVRGSVHHSIIHI